MRMQSRVIKPGCRNTKLVQGSKKTACLVKNPTRCLVELDRHIGELHHSFCGDQYDYVVSYYTSNITGKFKVKYAAKVIMKLVTPSLLAAGILILPALLHIHLELNLIIPCAVFLLLFVSYSLPKMVMLIKKRKYRKGKSSYDAIQWRILSVNEVEQLKEKITERFQALFTVCAREPKKWSHYRGKILAIQRKQVLYSGQSMDDLSVGDILYYRALSLFLALYKKTLAGLTFLLYAYTLTYLLITGMHSLSIDSLENVLDGLLLAAFLAFFLCFLQLFFSAQFLQNFKEQRAFFKQSAQQVKEKIASLNKQHQLS